MQSHVRARIEQNAQYHRDMAESYAGRDDMSMDDLRKKVTEKAPDAAPPEEVSNDGDVALKARRTEQPAAAPPPEPSENERTALLHLSTAQQLEDLVRDGSEPVPIADQQADLPRREKVLHTARGPRAIDTSQVHMATSVTRRG